MKTLDPEQLLNRYKTGECTPEELAIVEAYITHIGIIPQDLLAIESDIAAYKEQLKRPSRSRRINWPKSVVSVAAAITIFCGIWTLLFTNSPALPLNYVNDIDPGGNKAVLTLQNGKKIELSDAKTGVVIDASKLTYDDGALINNEISQTFMVSTPKGGTYQVRLPDGSKVWLNAASSLTYTPPLEGRLYRSVKLIGEAYFEVSKDIKRPFIVITDHQKVQVLGTHFNVSAYSDERSTKTTLLEGSVMVAPFLTSGVESKGIILKPNQESTISPTDISISEVNVDDIISWKNGEFSFTREPLESIMLKVSRWYNVEVIYTDPTIGDKLFNGTISKFEKVSQVLCLLQRTGQVQFKIEERRITVMK